MQCTGVGCGLGLRAEELPTVRRMPPLVLLPLVLLALLLLPRQLHADRIFWADSNRVGSLHDAVERAAEFGSTGATVGWDQAGTFSPTPSCSTTDTRACTSSAVGARQSLAR